LKLPFAGTTFLRLEAGYETWFETGSPAQPADFSRGYDVLRLSAGISAVLD
jgi:hypothetical protein